MHVIFLVNHPSYSFFHRPSSAGVPWSQTLPTHRMDYETDQLSNRNEAVAPLSDEGYQRSQRWSYVFATRLHFRRSDLAVARLRIAMTTCSQFPDFQTGPFVPLRFPQKNECPSFSSLPARIKLSTACSTTYMCPVMPFPCASLPHLPVRKVFVPHSNYL